MSRGRIPVLFLAAASACFADCSIWFNTGASTDQAAGLPILSLAAQSNGAIPITAMLTLNNGPNCNASLDLPQVNVVTPVGGNWLSVQFGINASSGAHQYWFTADPAGLPSGQYLAYLRLTGSGLGNSPFIFPVMLSVLSPGTDGAHPRSSLFGVSAQSGPFPASFSFEVERGGAQQFIDLLSYSGPVNAPLPRVAKLVPDAQSTTDWIQDISVFPVPLGIAKNTFWIQATAKSAGMPAGAYRAYLAVYDQPFTSAYVIPISMTIAPHPRAITASPVSLTMTYRTGAPASQSAATLSLSSSPSQASYSVTAPDWLNVSSPYGATNSSVTLTVNSARLPPFDSGKTAYVLTDVITVSNQSLPDDYKGSIPTSFTVPVTLNVSLGTPFPPGLYTSTALIDLSTDNQYSAPVTVKSRQGPAVPFKVTWSTAPDGGSWLQVLSDGSPVTQGFSTTTPKSLTISANNAGLTRDNYHGLVTLTPTQAGLPPVLIPVILELPNEGPDNGVAVSSRQLTFSTDPAQSAPQIILVTPLGNFRADQALYCTPYLLDTGVAAWLSVSPKNCSPSGQFSVAVNPAGLAPGTYAGVILLADDFGENLEEVTVVFNVLAASGPTGAILVVNN